MKNKILKKRINNWISSDKWQKKYIQGHHARASLLAKGILFKYRWAQRTPLHLKDLALAYCSNNKQIEKNRLNKLWGIR